MKSFLNKIFSSPQEIEEICKLRGIVSFINPYSYLLFRKKEVALSNVDYLYVDGFLLVHFIRYFYKKRINRFSFDMTSLAPEIFKYAELKRKNIYLLGDTYKSISNAVERIKAKYSNCHIVKYRHGFFSTHKEYADTLNEVISLNPDIVIVGMGALKQEMFLLDLKNKGWQGLGFTCGGFFHQINTELQYYPNYINKLNLRWVYRLIKEPPVRKRIFHIIFVFPFLFIKDKYK